MSFRDAVAAIITSHITDACDEILQLAARETAMALMPGDEKRGEPLRDAPGSFREYGTFTTPRKAASDHLDAIQDHPGGNR